MPARDSSLEWMAATTLASGLAVAAGVLVSIGWMVTPIVTFGLGWIGLGCAVWTDRSCSHVHADSNTIAE